MQYVVDGIWFPIYRYDRSMNLMLFSFLETLSATFLIPKVRRDVANIANLMRDSTIKLLGLLTNGN